MNTIRISANQKKVRNFLIIFPEFNNAGERQISLNPIHTMAKKAAVNANAGPTRPQIKALVIPKIDAEGGRNHAPAGQRARLRAGDEDIKLETDLNIGSTRRAALSIDYTRISRSFPGGLVVGPTSSSNADTLGKAVDLVFKRAHGVWN
jgi:hypothetical protein